MSKGDGKNWQNDWDSNIFNTATPLKITSFLDSNIFQHWFPPQNCKFFGLQHLLALVPPIKIKSCLDSNMFQHWFPPSKGGSSAENIRVPNL